MQIIDYKVKGQKEIEILPISDVHLGDPHCNLTLLKNTIAYIQDNPNVYCLLNGDLIDNGNRNSIGAGVYENLMSPQEQIGLMSEYLKPIKDKIICMTGGNHEDRAFKNCGIDANMYIANALGIQERYCNSSCYIFLTLCKGKVTVNDKESDRAFTWGIWLTHGSGGGKKIGGKANQVESMANVVDADIYLHSHTHQMLAFKQDYLCANSKSKTLKQKTRLFVNTNAFLRFSTSGEGGYAEKAKFSPSTNEIPKLVLGIRREGRGKEHIREKYMYCNI